MDFLRGSILAISHMGLAERGDFKELGISQRVLNYIIDSDFKELKIATWLKNDMGGAINRPPQKQ